MYPLLDKEFIALLYLGVNIGCVTSLSGLATITILIYVFVSHSAFHTLGWCHLFVVLINCHVEIMLVVQSTDEILFHMAFWSVFVVVPRKRKALLILDVGDLDIAKALS